MQELHSKQIVGTPFRITSESVQNKPGTWNSTKISIYRDDLYDIHLNVYRTGKLIGEYLRNYSSFGFDTFYPFQNGEDWYALYSASYTATRVLKLHEDRIEDWCGEADLAHGFCPTEFYVPRYIQSEHTMNMNGEDEVYTSVSVDCDYTVGEFNSEIESPDFRSLHYCNFGFLSGCVWGDDTSWKLRYIDLSQIPNKVLKITEKFGYWELPEGKLRDHIRMDGWEPGHDWIVLHKQEYINLNNNAES